MRRCRQTSTDSLELLLDTICNTFGGVLFIAILVIILLQMSGEQNTQSVENSDEVIVLEQQLTTQISRLQQEFTQLQDLVESQEKTLQLVAPPELQSLLGERINESDSLRQQQADREGIEEQLEAIREKREDVKKSRNRFQLTLQEEKSAVEVLQEQLELEKQSRRKELQTSVLSSPGLRTEIVLILQHDRLYVWHKYSLDGVRMGLNTDEFVVLKNGHWEVETCPNPVAGVPLNETSQSSVSLRKRLSHFSPDKQYLTLVVRPDSFDSFKFLRDVIVGLDFKYRLIPATEEQTFVDRGGPRGRVQ